MAKGEALLGKILIALGRREAGGSALRRAFTVAEQMQSPAIIYPVAYELGRWHESQGQISKAVELYRMAHAAVGSMATAVEDEKLQAVLRQTAPVQLLAEGLARIA